jgi:WD40 repeat protein
MQKAEHQRATWLRIIFLLSFCVLATGFASRAARAQTLELVLQTGHNGEIHSVVYSHDGKYLVSESNDATAKLWDVTTGAELRQFPSKAFQGRALAFSTDDKLLAVALRNEIQIWEVSTGKSINSFRGSDFKSVAFSPSGNLLAAADAEMVRFWKVNTGEQLTPLRTESEIIQFVSFTPNGDLAIARGTAIEFWSLTSRKKKGQIDHGARINCVALSPDGSVLASAGNDGVIKLWDASTVEALHILNSDVRPLKSLAFSRDAKTLAAAGGIRRTGVGPRPGSYGITLWDVKTGTVRNLLKGHTDQVTSLTFSPNSMTLVSGSLDYTIKFWDTERGINSRTLRRHSYDVQALSFSPDDSRLVAGDEMGNYFNWRWSDEREFDVLLSRFGATGENLKFSPDGKTFVSRRLLHEDLNFFGQFAPTSLQGSPSLTNRVAFSRDNSLLAAGDDQEKMKLWDVRTGKVLHVLTERISNIADLIFNSAGTLLAGICANDEGTVSLWGRETIKLWDVRTGNEKKQIAEPDALRVVFSPDDQTLISMNRGGMLKYWDTRTGGELTPLRKNLGGPDRRGIVEFSPDLKTVAFVRDTKIDLWQVSTGKKINTLSHSSIVHSLSFRSDGRVLASGASDATVKLWDIESGKELLSLLMLNKGDWLVVAPDGLFDGTADALKQVNWRVHNMNQVFSVESFFNDFFHPGLLSEIMLGGRPKATIGIGTLLQLPGFRAMVSAGQVRLDKRDTKPVLCFDEQPNARPQVYVDGQLLSGNTNEIFFPDDATCPYRVELPEGNQYEIVSASKLEEAKSITLPYDGNESSISTSTLHVQMIAVGNYDKATSGRTPLPASVASAKKLQDYFINQKHNPNKRYRDIRIWNGLYDAEATREAILKRLAMMAKEVNEDDVVVLLFSGHGSVPAGQEMFYFAPIDMLGPNPQQERETGLNTAMLAQALRAIRARRLVLIIDTCQSGGAIDSLAKIANLKAAIESHRSRLNQENQRIDPRHEIGVYVIAATTPLRLAVQQTESSMVATLLDVLNRPSETKGGQVWIRRVVHDIEQRLPRVAAKVGEPHRPMTILAGVDFPIGQPSK